MPLLWLCSIISVWKTTMKSLHWSTWLCVCREVVILLGLVKSPVPDRLSVDGWLLVDFRTLQRQPHYLRLFSQDQFLHKYITADLWYGCYCIYSWSNQWGWGGGVTHKNHTDFPFPLPVALINKIAISPWENKQNVLLNNIDLTFFPSLSLS